MHKMNRRGGSKSRVLYICLYEVRDYFLGFNFKWIVSFRNKILFVAETQQKIYNPRYVS